MAQGTYANMQQSRFVIFMRKIWPTFYRIFNTIIYFIIGVIRSIFKGIMDQIKGGI